MAWQSTTLADLPVSTLIILSTTSLVLVVVAAVVASWLIQFGVINIYNRYARMFVHALDAVTEPVFRRGRRGGGAPGGRAPFSLIVAIGGGVLRAFGWWLRGERHDITWG